MIIRKGKYEDFDNCTDIIKEFVSESLCEYGMIFSPERIRIMFDACLEHSLVAEIDNRVIGVIAGFPGENLVDGTPIFQEAIWYVLPDYRRYGIKLLKEFEKLIKEKGFNRMVIAQMGNLKFDKLRHFYERIGYTMMEVQYIKEL